MKLAAVIIAVVCLAVTEASTLQDEYQGFNELMFDGSSLSEEAGDLIKAMLQGTSKSVNCTGHECYVCGSFLFGVDVCVQVRTTGSKVIIELFTVIVYKHRERKEIVALEFENHSPKICLPHHECIQLRRIKIENNKLCASLMFNSKAVINNGCIPLLA